MAGKKIEGVEQKKKNLENKQHRAHGTCLLRKLMIQDPVRTEKQ
jgi:hypothetical protein